AGALKSAGADRDSMEAGLGRLAQEPRDEGLEKMKALMASAANTVAGDLKGFDFSSGGPRGRASKGLYFGPTVKGFSYC
ncbi:MAG TPA: hypothetical protein VGO52_12400, partial [Hyphomonadaceae bacterium]|nr:hypothetical protein [Hyphomonadaceae bacterium]